MKFNHVGIPTTTRFEGEIDLPHLRVTVSDHQSNPFGIQWMRYWEDAPVPDLVKTVAHVAFEVDDLEQAVHGQEVIIPPNSPSAGVMVAFIITKDDQRRITPAGQVPWRPVPASRPA